MSRYKGVARGNSLGCWNCSVSRVQQVLEEPISIPCPFITMLRRTKKHQFWAGATICVEFAHSPHFGAGFLWDSRFPPRPSTVHTGSAGMSTHTLSGSAGVGGVNAPCGGRASGPCWFPAGTPGQLLGSAVATRNPDLEWVGGKRILPTCF